MAYRTALDIEKKRQEAVADLLQDMEKIAADMRVLIAGMPPEDILGYCNGQVKL